MINKTILRPYQIKAIDDIYTQWDLGMQFVVLVMPTGSGKSETVTEIARREVERGQTVLILAHRRELITQLSGTVARKELRHMVRASESVVKSAVRSHMEKYGRTFHDPSRPKVYVASVQSLKDSEVKELAAYGNKLTIIQDEFHHATKTSATWGGILTPLDEAGARGLGCTATPQRADGKGLSRQTDGYGDCIVLGPTPRWLIDNKYLSEYRIYCPKSDLDLARVSISKSTGDYKDTELKEEIKKSHIVGDVVDQYLKICPGKRGITFTVGIENAELVAAQYRLKGVPAIALSGKNADAEREQAIKDLISGKILQIVNDSLIGEGVDIPAVEVVTFARPTESLGLYIQMFGRALRVIEGKPYAIIIDHVGNVMRHGLPDAPREWSLDRRERRSAGKSDAETVRTCQACTAVYERYLDGCPFCGEPVPAPAVRSGPEFVDGDLYELDAVTLAQLRGEVSRVDMSPQDYRDQLAQQGVPQIGIMANVKRHVTRQETVSVLRDTMAQWGGWERARGLSDKEIFRKFYLTYGVDWLTAQASKTDGALSLTEKLNKDMPK